MQEIVLLSLESIHGGGLNEQFQVVLQEVLDDIQDVNKPPDKARAITVKIKITPSKSRQEATMTYEVAKKVPPNDPQQTLIYMANQNGVGVAQEAGPPAQMTINDYAEGAAPADNVTPMRRESAND